MMRLYGVVAAGTLTDVPLNGQLVRAVPVHDPLGQTEFQLPLKAASPGLFRAVRATIGTGRVLDAGNSERADRVAVLGPTAADQLHLTRVDNQPAIYIGERLYTVMGILANVERQSGLLNSVIIPEGTARREFGVASPGNVQVETRVGAASLIASQMPLALVPTDINALKVTAPPEAKRIKEQNQSSTRQGLFACSLCAFDDTSANYFLLSHPFLLITTSSALMGQEKKRLAATYDRPSPWKHTLKELLHVDSSSARQAWAMPDRAGRNSNVLGAGTA